MNDSAPQTAARLLQRAPAIMRRWEARVRAEVPAAKSQQPSVLQNNLRRLLAEVARSLAPTSAVEELIEGLTIAQDHGGSRAQLAEYTLAEVFFEYRLLRRTILEVLDEEQLLSAAEREAITDALELAMQDAGSQYALVQQAVERGRGDDARQLAAELRAAYDRERRITQVLQRPLLLKVAEDAFPGLAVATLYEPAGGEAEVGGDFLDAFALPGGTVALVVGDASGHGLEAAVHNAHVKDVLRAFLRELPRDPGSTMARLNEVVCDTLQADEAFWDRFIVLSLVVLDPLTGEAYFTSAGAEPPLVLRASGGVEVVQASGMALGIEVAQEYVAVPLRLEPGDTVVVVTDGLTEARCGPDLLGIEGVARLAAESLGQGSLHDAAQAIMAGAHAFGRDALSDDSCLILARRR